MGQFLDHDIDLAPITPSDQVFQSENASNDVCANQAPFFPIEVLPDDPRIHSNCMSFTRSAGICGTGSSSVLVSDATVRREQINAITAFIDGSQVSPSSPTALVLHLFLTPHLFLSCRSMVAPWSTLSSCETQLGGGGC